MYDQLAVIVKAFALCIHFMTELTNESVLSRLLVDDGLQMLNKERRKVDERSIFENKAGCYMAKS